MKRFPLLAGASLLTWGPSVFAQPAVPNHDVPGYEIPNGTSGPMFQPFSGPVTETSVLCGAASTAVLGAGSASAFVQYTNPSSSTATVWLNIAGAAATLAPPSIDLPPGVTRVYSAASTFVSQTSASCIVQTASVAISVIYK
jgi:hypothetical protein